MNKRFFLPALLCGLIVAILTIGCNNVLLKKENNFSVSFVTPVIDGTSSRVSRSVTGVDWNITAWLELQDGSTLQTQETRAASGVPVSLPFEPVEVGTELKVKVELLGIANGIKYADESDWIVVKAEDNPIDLTPSLVPDTTAPLGSQTNPVTTWADLVTIVSDSTTTNAIYIAGTPDSSGLYTMEATSSITISSNTTIIPTNNVTIIRKNNFTDKLFNVTGTLNLGNSSNSFIITLDGQNSAVEQPLVYSSGTLNMTNSVITKNNNSNDYVSPSSLFIFSGTTTLNNVSFSGNTSGLSGAADIYLHQGSSQAQLNLAESFAATEIYFSVAMSTTYPVIQLNQNLSLQDANKVKITVGSTTPENIQVVNKNGYTGDLNAFFEVVGTNNTTYSLNDEGKVEIASISNYDEGIGLSYDSTSNILTIHNEAGLKNFRDIVNGTLAQAITVGGKTYTVQETDIDVILAEDITLTENWIPIGNSSSKSFQGTFDGQNKTISGITISDNGNNPVGFFAYLGSDSEGATVKNLIVSGTINSNHYTGGIAGYVAGATTIESCINKINIENSANSSGVATGGIIGYVYETATLTVSDCVNFGNLTGNQSVGGLVGKNENATIIVDKSINMGNLIATNTTDSGYAGGIMGNGYGGGITILNCLNKGFVAGSHAAGIAYIESCNSSEITNSLNVGPTSKYVITSSLTATDVNNYHDAMVVGIHNNTYSSNRNSTNITVDNLGESWTQTDGYYPLPDISSAIGEDIWQELKECSKVVGMVTSIPTEWISGATYIINVNSTITDNITIPEDATNMTIIFRCPNGANTVNGSITLSKGNRMILGPTESTNTYQLTTTNVTSKGYIFVGSKATISDIELTEGAAVVPQNQSITSNSYPVITY
ncbi:MAG: hypothetical protein J6R67_00830 [Treponema sp.]|nr:hypothetical protein [Treponema sp.]